MFLTLLLLFTVLPIVEIWLLGQMWSAVGLPLTLLIALGTGVLGASLARRQGLATLARINEQFASGKPPADALVDGAMILLAGAVLITPGVLTDAFGFALLLPPVRAALKPLLAAAFRRSVQRGTVRVFTVGGGAAPGRPANEPPLGGGDVIDAEVIDVRTRDADASS